METGQKFGDIKCDARPMIVQRQASGLRTPESLTIFSIPPRHTEIGKLLQNPHLIDIISALDASSLDDSMKFLGMLKNMVTRGKLLQNLYSEIKLYCMNDWPSVRDAITEINDSTQASNMQGVIDEEFRRLMEGAEFGIPSVHSNKKGGTIFEIDPNDKGEFRLSQYNMVVQPVKKLRATMVQRGYRRIIRDSSGQLPGFVDIGFPDGTDVDTWWYPGIELGGEGLFFFLKDGQQGDMNSSGKSFSAWTVTQRVRDSYDESLFRDATSRYELDPVFAWWHTLSHSAIRAISEISGYPSSAIRERVYYNGDGKLSSGGFILYVIQPGGDGSMGGLRAISRNPDDIVKRIAKKVDACSGDPICREHGFRGGGYVGGACYACMMISETSCEHRNMWLDRNLLMENGV
jgi:hypothetical protein